LPGQAAADDANGDTGADAAHLPERGLAEVRVGEQDVERNTKGLH
jgi:hypothetical protein